MCRVVLMLVHTLATSSTRHCLAQNGCRSAVKRHTSSGRPQVGELNVLAEEYLIEPD
jgi:hypothetical protein